ncbi:hypothetical protein [Aestuariibaculum sediminum]|uniref:Uncharacterized protein n=1 Tax=Aestuariibaculum sediminum TaxID=2770637 RepID=A0A8J6Q2N8_9FLAO|nr:hypothetical protein [Aestuariibaculum sediminum]MBD0833722.1 hypothetical protein [Aestuariibaculum sediminum]
MNLKKKIIGMLGVTVIATAVFFTSNLNIHKGGNYTLGELITAAVAQTETGGGTGVCFTKTIISCGSISIYGDMAICDQTGDYKQGETCQPIECSFFTPPEKSCIKY